MCDDISWDVQNVKTKENKDGTFTISSDVFWKSPLWMDENDKQRPFVKEDISITVYSESDSIRIIDFEIILHACERIGKRKNI